MAGSNTAVSGVYRTQSALELGVQALNSLGFHDSDISIIRAENGETSDPGKLSRAPQVAAAGASIGVVLGGILGWLMGSGSLAIPGLGLLIAAGPVVAALVGAGAGGAMGGMAGGMVGLGIDERDANGSPGRPTDDEIVISVSADDGEWARLARGVLESTGARSVSYTEEESTEVHQSERTCLH